MYRRTILGDPPPVHITGQDLGRLDVLLAGMSSKSTRSLEFLRDELDRAQLVDDERAMKRFVQTGSRVLFSDDFPRRAAPDRAIRSGASLGGLGLPHRALIAQAAAPSKDDGGSFCRHILENDMTDSARNNSADRRPRQDQRARRADIVELASLGSFPASDPPPWTLGTSEGTRLQQPERSTDDTERVGGAKRRG